MSMVVNIASVVKHIAFSQKWTIIARFICLTANQIAKSEEKNNSNAASHPVDEVTTECIN